MSKRNKKRNMTSLLVLLSGSASTPLDNAARLPQPIKRCRSHGLH